MRTIAGTIVYHTKQERATHRMGLQETLEILEVSRWIQMREEWSTVDKWPPISLYYES